MVSNRRLAKKIVDEFVDILRDSSQGSGKSTCTRKHRRVSKSSSIQQSSGATAYAKLSLNSHLPNRQRADDSSTLRGVKQDPKYVNSVVRTYTSGGGHVGNKSVTRNKRLPASKHHGVPESTPDVVKFKLKLYEKASGVIANHARGYLKHKRVAPGEMKMILKQSTKEYFQAIRPSLSRAAEQCIRFPDYHKYFAVEDVIKVEAIQRVVKSHLKPN